MEQQWPHQHRTAHRNLHRYLSSRVPFSNCAVRSEPTELMGAGHYAQRIVSLVTAATRRVHRASRFFPHDATVGIKEVADKVWLVSFMQYDLGFFDHETGRITSAENPFGAKVLPMCSE